MTLFTLVLEIIPHTMVAEEIISSIHRALEVIGCEDRIVQGATSVAQKKSCVIKILPAGTRAPYTQITPVPSQPTVLRATISCAIPSDLVYVAKMLINSLKTHGFTVRVVE